MRETTLEFGGLLRNTVRNKMSDKRCSKGDVYQNWTQILKIKICRRMPYKKLSSWHYVAKKQTKYVIKEIEFDGEEI